MSTALKLGHHAIDGTWCVRYYLIVAVLCVGIMLNPSAYGIASKASEPFLPLPQNLSLWAFGHFSQPVQALWPLALQKQFETSTAASHEHLPLSDTLQTLAPLKRLDVLNPKQSRMKNPYFNRAFPATTHNTVQSFILEHQTAPQLIEHLTALYPDLSFQAVTPHLLLAKGSPVVLDGLSQQLPTLDVATPEVSIKVTFPSGQFHITSVSGHPVKIQLKGNSNSSSPVLLTATPYFLKNGSYLCRIDVTNNTHQVLFSAESMRFQAQKPKTIPTSFAPITLTLQPATASRHEGDAT